jgi:hypothetical protein
MLKPVLVVSCLFASWFVVFTLIGFGDWGRALVYGVYGSLVFSLTLFVASLASQGRPWRAFWIANIALILLFGGLDIYSMLTIKDSHATRFGGGRLVIDGRITATGFASTAFDISICTLSNFLGFYLARRLIKRFSLE